MPESASARRHVQFGPFELDVHTGELRKGSTRLKVPIQSIEILKALLEQPGELVTREHLRQRLWPGDTFVDFEHGLNAAIRRLREALGDSADTPRFIETLPRRGYRFMGALGQTSFVEPRSEPAIEPDGIANPSHAIESLRRRRIRPRHFVIAAIVVCAAALSLWIAERARGAATSLKRPDMKTIPVTSLVGQELDPHISPDGNQVAFAWDHDVLHNFDIYVKLIDGGAPVRITTDPAPEFSPAWSPDGRRLAFLRAVPGRGGIVVMVPAFGGPERVVTGTRVPPGNRNEVSWTPDGLSLLIVDRGASSTAGIFVHSIDTGERWPLTQPTRHFSDTSPVISPDGRYLAFVRRILGFTQGDVWLQPLEQLRPTGEPHALTHDRYTSTLDWAHDSRSIVYDHIRGGALGRGLWQVPLDGGEPRALLTNVEATGPSLARDGSRLLYCHEVADTNIWRIPGPARGRPARSEAQPMRLIASTFSDMSPSISAAGDRIAFVSDRSGTPEIWVAQSDGSREMQLTTFAGAFTGSPRWSADGNWIAFDSMQSGSWNIYVVGSQGGAVRAVTRDASNNARPSWSRDGKWIYFSSNRTGRWEIWKTPVGGGTPVQITKQGGLEALESPDGRYLYYAKVGNALGGKRGIWQVPIDGGSEIQVLDRGMATSWGVTDQGIVVMDKAAEPATVEFFVFAEQRIVTIATLRPGLRFDPTNPSFAVSRDGQWIVYVQRDQVAADIEMLEGFR